MTSYILKIFAKRFRKFINKILAKGAKKFVIENNAKRFKKFVNGYVDDIWVDHS